MKHTFALIAMGFAFCCLMPTVQADSPSTMPQHPNLLASCVTITTIDGSGSGFFASVSNRICILTCRHVVENQPFLEVKDIYGTVYPVRGGRMSEERDIAVLDCEKEEGDGPAPLPLLTNARSLWVDMPLACYGDSEGRGVIVKSEGKMLGIGPESIETDAEIVLGNSGGPIVSQESGEVVAIASFLTKSQMDRWNMGTRFAGTARRFGIRIDNLHLDTGRGIPISFIDKNDLEAVFQFGKTLIESQDDALLNTGFACFEYAAEHEYPSALSALAVEYLTAGKDETARAKGWGYAFKAAELGDDFARFILAQCLMKGIGVQKDVERGMGFLYQAATNGSEAAQARLGEIYYNGEYTQKDEEKAFYWLKQAAEKGVERAQYLLSSCYARGIGVEQNSSLSAYWLQHSAENNDPEGLYLLARCYEKGNGSEKDITKANHLYQKSAEAGNIAAQLLVAQDIARGGTRFSGDKTKAFELMLAASKHDDADEKMLALAFWGLAMYYDNGIGVEPNGEQVIENYIKAGEHGNTECLCKAAQYLLSGKTSSGNRVSQNPQRHLPK